MAIFAYKPKASKDGIQFHLISRISWENIASAKFERIRGYPYIVIEKKAYSKILRNRLVHIPLSLRGSSKFIDEVKAFAPVESAILSEIRKFDPSSSIDLKWKIYRWTPAAIFLLALIASWSFKLFILVQVTKLSDDAKRGVFTYLAEIEACEYKQDTSRPTIYQVKCCKQNAKETLPTNTVSLDQKDKGVLLLSKASWVLPLNSTDVNKYSEKFFYKTDDPAFCEKLKTHVDGQIKAKFHDCRKEGFLSPPCVFGVSHEIEPSGFPKEMMK